MQTKGFYKCEQCGREVVDVGVYHYNHGKRVCYECMYAEHGAEMDAARENGPESVISIAPRGGTFTVEVISEKKHETSKR